MHVVATAGHVDHGKSTLVRALTGMEPDRLDEEHRRGLTIELGHVWMTQSDGTVLAFVDVPGHERFIATMLTGLGPAPAVLLVVAADEGWRQQTTEHVAAITALGLTRGAVAVTRSDLTDPAATITDVGRRVVGTPLVDWPVLPVSGTTGEGLGALRGALEALVASLPAPVTDARVRLWVDRSFTIRGAGTVVTGTLGAGSVHVGESLVVASGNCEEKVYPVRGLHTLGASQREVAALARVAINLRGVDPGQVRRGAALLSPHDWACTSVADVRLISLDDGPVHLPRHLMAHLGTTSAEVRVRPLGDHHARLSWPVSLPLQVGDRLVLRDPGQRRVLCGALVLDIDPPTLGRHGAAADRGLALTDAHEVPDPVREVVRRGAMTAEHVRLLTGVPATEIDWPPTITRCGDWMIAEAMWSTWRTRLTTAVEARAAADPLHPRLSAAAAIAAAQLPDASLLDALTLDAGLSSRHGVVARPEASPDLGRAEAGLRDLEQRWTIDPFAAPNRDDLTGLGLGRREIAAAAGLGRVLDLGDLVIVAPSSAEVAARRLADLDQPFTVSQARQALGTTRRVAVPLLEHLDRQGITRRRPDATRVLSRPHDG